MQYADRDTKQRRLFAALATLLYALLWVLLVGVVTFRTSVPDERIEQIVIDFGQPSETTGSSGAESPAADAPADAAQPADLRNTENPLTQQTDDAPAVPPPPTPVVDPRALFPGRGAADDASGGSSPSTADAGRGSGAGTGAGNDDVNLGGRSLVGTLPKPDYPVREEGRVIIEIRVDQQGRVVGASFRSRGSTTTNTALVAAAEQAALKARFDVNEDAPVTQTGTITYNFRLQ
jgi:TonB family protein